MSVSSFPPPEIAPFLVTSRFVQFGVDMKYYITH